MSRRIAALSAVAALGILLVAPACPVAATPKVDEPTSSVEYSLPSDVHFYEISCPSALVCTAVGGDDVDRSAVFRTTDGGSSWSQETLPGGTYVTGLSCPTVEFCIAVTTVPRLFGYGIWSTQDGGTTWTQVGGGGSLSAVLLLGCAPGTTVCYTSSGTYTSVTTDGGSTWSSVSSASPIVGASCPTASTCYFVTEDGIAETTDAGATVTPVAAATGTVRLSCPSVDECAATESGQYVGSFLESSDGGSTWTLGVLPQGFNGSAALTCVSLEVCTAMTWSSVGEIETASTTDGGVTWAEQTILGVAGSGPPLSFESGIACPSASACFFANDGTAPDTVYLQSGSGEPWVATSVLTGTSPPLEAVGCGPTATCAAVGSGVALYSADGGSTWTDSTRPPALDAYIAAVSCPTATFCLAVGSSSLHPGAAVAIRSVDGGRYWQGRPIAEALYTTLPSMTGLVCTGLRDCLATTSAGDDLLRSTNAGQQWLPVALPSNLTDVSDLSCVGADCKVLAIRGTTGSAEVLVSSNGGARWVTRSTEGVAGIPLSMSCTSSAVCWSLAADSSTAKVSVEHSTDSGAQWRRIATVEASTPAGGSIDCTASRCTALVVKASLGLPDGFTLKTGGPGGSWAVTPLPSSVSLLGTLAPGPGGRGWIASGVNQADGPVIVGGH